VLGNLWLASRLVAQLEFDTLDRTSRDDLGAQPEAHNRYQSRSQQVGTQQAAEAHARAHHSDNLAVVGQLGSEEDDSDEDEECREEVGVERDEVHVVLQQPQERSVVHRELVGIFREVEHHGDGDDENDGEEVRPQELGDDVAVEPGKEISLQCRQERADSSLALLTMREGLVTVRCFAFFASHFDEFLFLFSFCSLVEGGVGLIYNL